MSRPVVSDAAERLYAVLAAYQDGDEASGWVLLHMCEATARMLAKCNDALRQDTVGSGWRRMHSPYRAPAWALPWLAQHAGVPEIPADLTETQARDLIASAPGMRRGTPAAIVAAAQRYLTGNKTVILLEREGGPYKLTVITRPDETPDADRVLAALLTQKPSGITLSHVLAIGEVWGEPTAAWDAAGTTSWDDTATTSI